MELKNLMKNRMGRKELIVLILCFVIGFGLRFYGFDQKSLWMDEIHTYNDSTHDLKSQFQFYKENPAFLHPPLFFILTHLFYPFEKPERDLRIIPLVFGTLSIPMIYLLSGSFSAPIALPCMLSLTFMTYHISLSQDGRVYAFLLFFGMASLYFFMRHLQTLKKRYLVSVSICFAILFHASYSSIPFIALSQILWFYRAREDGLKPSLSSFFILNGLLFLFCLPWVTFTASHYRGEVVMDPFHTEDPGPLWRILYGVLHDWAPQPPLMIASVILLLLFPFFVRYRRNAFVLLAVFIVPVAGLYFFCKLLKVTHFITSRYFISFLPLFFIGLYLSLDALEGRLGKLRRFLRLKVIFVILFIASNLVILPLYYRSEKQDLRGLVTYLKAHAREGDKIFVETEGFMPGILHYVGAHPKERHHVAYPVTKSGEQVGLRISFLYQGKMFTLYHSKTCCTQYVLDGSRLWIVTSKWGAKKIQRNSPCVLKGYFDGSFLNFNRFPDDASMYLFLWDVASPDEKGIDLPVQ
jgi:hypothetical protein